MAAKKAEATVEDTGIFRRVWVKLETGEEVFEAYLKAMPRWFDAEKQLSQIEKYFRSVIQPHLATPEPGTTQIPPLMENAPLAARDAFDALIELSVLRRGIEMLRPVGRDKQFGRMLIAALHVGFAHCQVQVRAFEPFVMQKRVALKKGPLASKEHAETLRRLIRAEGARLLSSGQFKTLSQLNRRLLDREGKPLTDAKGQPIEGFLMPKLTVIAQATRGLKPMRSKPPKLRPR